MPIKLELIRDGRVLVRTLTDPVDVQQLFESFSYGAREIMDPSPHTIHLILDVSQTRNIPNNLLTMGLKADKIKHPKTGQVVVVSTSGFIKTIINLLHQLSHSKPIAASTLEEALKYIDRVLAEEAKEHITAQEA
jgi:hypothetical protein